MTGLRRRALAALLVLAACGPEPAPPGPAPPEPAPTEAPPPGPAPTPAPARGGPRGPALVRRAKLRAHAEPTRLALHPDGRHVVTAHTRDVAIDQWDLRTGARAARVETELGTSAVAFSPDGAWLVTCFNVPELDQRGVVVRAAATLEVKGTIKVVGEYAGTPAFSPDGKRLAFLTAEGPSVWDTATWKRERVLEGKNPGCLAFDPAGARLVTGHGKLVKVWDLASGGELAAFDLRDDVQSVAFSPDGSVLAIGCATKVELRRGPSLAPLHPDAAPGPALKDLGHLAFSRDGRLVAAIRSAGLTLWDVATGALLADVQPDPYANRWNDVAFTGDGALVTNDWSGDLQVWTLAPWVREAAPAPAAPAASALQPARVLEGHLKPVRGLAFSPTTDVLLSGSDDRTVRRWDPTTGAETGREQLLIEVQALAASGDGKLLACAGHRSFQAQVLVVLDADLRRQRSLDAPGVFVPSAVAFRPDGATLALGGAGVDVGAVLLHDLKRPAWNTKDEHDRPIRDPELAGHAATVNAVAYTQDGKTLVTASDDGTVRLWAATPGGARERQVIQVGAPVSCLAIRPGGRHVVVGTTKGGVLAYDLGSGAAAGQVAGHATAVWAVAIRPDGSVVASASHDGEVKLWSLQTGAELGVLRGHRGPVRALAFSRDGATLASGGDDHAIRLWPVPR